MRRRHSVHEIEEITPGVCTGCNRATAGLKKLKLGVSTEVSLCDGRELTRIDPASNEYYEHVTVSATCLRRARERLALCPGCGGDDQTPGTICDACQAAIARDKAAVSQQMKVYRICTTYVLGQYAGGEHQKPIEKASRLLARAVSGHRFWPNGASAKIMGTIGDREHFGGGGLAADPCVELTDEQAKALREFSKALGEAMEAQFEAGKEEGRNLLLGLARGEMTTADYEERIERRKRR